MRSRCQDHRAPIWLFFTIRTGILLFGQAVKMTCNKHNENLWSMGNSVIKSLKLNERKYTHISHTSTHPHQAVLYWELREAFQRAPFITLTLIICFLSGTNTHHKLYAAWNTVETLWMHSLLYTIMPRHIVTKIYRHSSLRPAICTNINGYSFYTV